MLDIIVLFTTGATLLGGVAKFFRVILSEISITPEVYLETREKVHHFSITKLYDLKSLSAGKQSLFFTYARVERRRKLAPPRGRSQTGMGNIGTFR